MKKILIQSFIASFILLAIISCNNGEKKTDQQKVSATDEPINADSTIDVNCSTIGNFLVSRQFAEERMRDFMNIFKKEDKRLSDRFWIDACLISSFKLFFDKHPDDYDGARLYSIFKKDSTDILIVPTSPFEGVGHDDKWDAKIPLISKCTPVFSNYNLDFKTQVFGWKRSFEKIIRGEKVDGDVNSTKKDSLSRGIWFSKCVFDSLSKYLDKPELKLDGVRIYSAAYDKMITGTMQKKAIQSTFVIVFTRSDGTIGHSDAWDVLETRYGREKRFNSGGYNHGQLCPTVCL